MNAEAQDAIVARIQKGPPRDHWPKKVNAAEVQNARLYWSLRELRRIEVGGGVLPDRLKAWFDAQSAQFAELAEMPLDEGFPGGITVTSREAKPDAKLDTLSGIERLKALEAALGTGRRGWDDDPAQCVSHWINQQGNAEKVIADFETTNNGGDDFPKVWKARERGRRYSRAINCSSPQRPDGAFAPSETFLRTGGLVRTVGDGVNIRDGANAPSSGG